MWIFGIILAVLSTLCGTVGKQLIRLSEILSKYKTSKGLFHAGMVINTVAGPLLDMAAYSFAPQSLIAPFTGLDVVWNAALAPYVLKETLTTTRVLACTLIFCGTLLSGVFGSHDEGTYTIETLEDKLVDWRVVIYLVSFAAWVAFNVAFPMRRPKGDIMRGASLGLTAGTIAGNMFCVKVTIELIEGLIREGDWSIWTHWLPYVMIAGAAFFALSNLYFMTKGLMEYEALFMVTVYEGSNIVVNVLSASVILLELEDLEIWQLVGFLICVGAVIAGMVVVCVGEAKAKDEEAAAKSGDCAASVEDGSYCSHNLAKDAYCMQTDAPCSSHVESQNQNSNQAHGTIATNPKYSPAFRDANEVLPLAPEVGAPQAQTVIGVEQESQQQKEKHSPAVAAPLDSRTSISKEQERVPELGFGAAPGQVKPSENSARALIKL